MFQHWHNGGSLACRYNSLAKGQVEDACEDTHKLLSTCSEHTSRNANKPIFKTWIFLNDPNPELCTGIKKNGMKKNLTDESVGIE